MSTHKLRFYFIAAWLWLSATASAAFAQNQILNPGVPMPPDSVIGRGNFGQSGDAYAVSFGEMVASMYLNQQIVPYNFGGILPLKAVPGANDVLAIQDQASGQLKSITVSALQNAGATLQAAPGNPNGTTSSTGVMMGLGTTCKITPVYSTRVQVWFTGDLGNGTAADGALVTAAFGTGTAPSNAASPSGTSIGVQIGANPVSASGNFRLPFTVGGVITGLTPGTAYWFDLNLAASAGGTATALNLSCTAIEF